MPVVFTVADLQFWGIGLVNIPVRMVISQLHRTSVTHSFLTGILLRNSDTYEGIFCERANYTH